VEDILINNLENKVEEVRRQGVVVRAIAEILIEELNNAISLEDAREFVRSTLSEDTLFGLDPNDSIDITREAIKLREQYTCS